MEIDNQNKDIYFENEYIVEEGDSNSEDSGTDEPAVDQKELPLNLVKLEEPQLTPIPAHEVPLLTHAGTYPIWEPKLPIGGELILLSNLRFKLRLYNARNKLIKTFAIFKFFLHCILLSLMF